MKTAQSIRFLARLPAVVRGSMAAGTICPRRFYARLIENNADNGPDCSHR